MSESKAPTENPVVDELMATCALFHTRRAARAITGHFDRYFKPLGIKATQFSLLAVVAAAQGRTLSEIANYMSMDRTALARDLRMLEELGLVRIESPANDRRTRVMVLTAKGRRIVDRALPRWREAQAHVVTAMQSRWPAMLEGFSIAAALP